MYRQYYGSAPIHGLMEKLRSEGRVPVTTREVLEKRVTIPVANTRLYSYIGLDTVSTSRGFEIIKDITPELEKEGYWLANNIHTADAAFTFRDGSMLVVPNGYVAKRCAGSFLTGIYVAFFTEDYLKGMEGLRFTREEVAGLFDQENGDAPLRLLEFLTQDRGLVQEYSELIKRRRERTKGDRNNRLTISGDPRERWPPEALEGANGIIESGRAYQQECICTMEGNELRDRHKVFAKKYNWIRMDPITLSGLGEGWTFKEHDISLNSSPGSDGAFIGKLDS